MRAKGTSYSFCSLTSDYPKARQRKEKDKNTMVIDN